MTTKDSNHYILTYRDPKDAKVIELKAKTIKDSTLGLSFISISDFIFESNTLVVNPVEENLKKRFEKVKSLHISIYTILTIEEVGSDHDGLKFSKDKSNLVILPAKESDPRT